MCSYPNTSALSEQIDSAGSLTVDNVVSLSFLGLDINIEGSHILDRDGGLDLDRDGGLDPFYDSCVGDAVFSVVLDDEVGDNGFFAGLPGNSLFNFFNNRLCGCAARIFSLRASMAICPASRASYSAFVIFVLAGARRFTW